MQIILNGTYICEYYFIIVLPTYDTAEIKWPDFIKRKSVFSVAFTSLIIRALDKEIDRQLENDNRNELRSFVKHVGPLDCFQGIVLHHSEVINKFIVL